MSQHKTAVSLCEEIRLHLYHSNKLKQVITSKWRLHDNLCANELIMTTGALSEYTITTGESLVGVYQAISSLPIPYQMPGYEASIYIHA